MLEPFHWIGPIRPAPYCVFSQSFLGCEDWAITSAGDFQIQPPFHHLPIWKRQVSRSQPLIIMMSFSQQEERLQMGQKPPTQLVSGLLLKAEKAGNVSQRMTKEQNNIQPTGGGKKTKKQKKLCCGIVIYSRLWKNCPLESFSRAAS